MARLLDANTVYAGLEPKYTKELSQIELMKALNWYSQNKDTKDAYKYASDYFKKNFKTDIGDTIKEYPSTFGWLCRIVSNGGSLSIKNQVYFDDKVKEIKNAVDEAKKKPKVVEQKPTTPVTSGRSTRSLARSFSRPSPRPVSVRSDSVASAVHRELSEASSLHIPAPSRLLLRTPPLVP